MGPDDRAVAPLRYWLLLRKGTKNEVHPWSGSLPKHVSYPEAFGLSSLTEVVAIIRNPEELLLVNTMERAEWPAEEISAKNSSSSSD